MIDPAPATSRDPVTPRAARLLDLVPLTVVVAAALYFVGWSYRQTYYRHFALDPSSLGGSNIAIAVEGAGALAQMVWQWMMASRWLLAVTLAMLVLVAAIERLPAHRARARAAATRTRAAGRTNRSGWIAVAAFAALFVGLSGQLAGRWHARDRVDNVRRGETWSYHLPRETIHGVTIAQAGELTWILTCSGMRPLRTGEIQRIDGPLFQRVLVKGSRARGPGCTAPSRPIAR